MIFAVFEGLTQHGMAVDLADICHLVIDILFVRKLVMGWDTFCL